jgi:hypothetical protein
MKHRQLVNRLVEQTVLLQILSVLGKDEKSTQEWLSIFKA